MPCDFSCDFSKIVAERANISRIRFPFRVMRSTWNIFWHFNLKETSLYCYEILCSLWQIAGTVLGSEFGQQVSFRQKIGANQSIFGNFARILDFVCTMSEVVHNYQFENHMRIHMNKANLKRLGLYELLLGTHFDHWIPVLGTPKTQIAPEQF